MKQIHNIVAALSLIILIPSLSESKQIIRSVAQFPEKVKATTATCSDKAQTLVIETQMAQANEYFRKGDYKKAVEHYHMALDLHSDHIMAHYNLGLAYLALEDMNNARKMLLRACELDPSHTQAHYFLGYIYQLEKRYDTAITYYDHAIATDREHFDSHLNKARALSNLEKLDDAIRSYEQALSIHALNLSANFELGYLHNRNGNLEASIHYYRRAVEVDPERTDSNCNLAHVLRYAGHLYDAIPFYKKVIEQSPNNPHAHCGLAECYLATGRFKEGFAHFERRFNRMPDTRNMQHKRWDGVANLHGKTILVRAEFGQGDTIQFARYLPLLKEKGARIILELQHTLIELFKHAPYVDDIIMVQDPVDTLPAFDYQIPIMSLPAAFKTSIETIPTDIPYIYTDATIDAYWEQQLQEDTNIKIGIVWEGSVYYEQFKSPYSKKAIPLDLFEPITHIPSVTVYSLQKMNGTEQLLTMPIGMEVHDFGPDFDIAHGRFMDTASVIKKMDVVVSVDTSVAHLAGALGIPVWVLLPYVADWRWLTERTDSVWYPTMQLFRQQKPSSWKSVIAEVTEQLKKMVSKSTQQSQTSKSPVAEVSIGELIDKMTILEIKSERIHDTAKLHNIANELQALTNTFDTYVHVDDRTQELFRLIQELKSVNEQLWEIEDNIRDKEAQQQFDDGFIQLARSVYFTNDERGKLKRAINNLLGSRLVEEKLYKSY